MERMTPTKREKERERKINLESNFRSRWEIQQITGINIFLNLLNIFINLNYKSFNEY